MGWRTCRWSASLALLLAAQGLTVAPALGAPARGDALEWPPVPAPPRPNGSLSLTLENDFCAATDRHYTNGVRLTALFAPPRALEAWAGQLGRGVDLGIAVGQLMFTPEDLGSAEPVEGDRPYAGWLYAGLVLRLRGGGHWDLGGAPPVLDTFELDLGFVGRASLAGDTQQWVHDALDNKEPRGWHNQVEQGFAAQLTWQRRVRLLSLDLPLELELDVVPHFGATAGLVLAGANGGGTVRLGWNIPADFGGLEDDGLALPLARHGETRLRPAPFGAWLFARADLRAVAFDVSLDGSLTSRGHHVRREPLVVVAEVGVMASLGERVLLGYTQTIKSPEFSDQEYADAFGSFFLQVSY